MARAMTAWARDIVWLTDGAPKLSRAQRQQLARNGIGVEPSKVARLIGARGRLRAVEFQNGTRLPRDTLFFDMPSRTQSDLARSLGCRFARHGGVLCGQYEATSVPGVFVAGNIIRDVQLSIVAAAEGARAAFGINRALTREDFERRATGARRIEHPRLRAAQRGRGESAGGSSAQFVSAQSSRPITGRPRQVMGSVPRRADFFVVIRTGSARPF